MSYEMLIFVSIKAQWHPCFQPPHKPFRNEPRVLVTCKYDRDTPVAVAFLIYDPWGGWVVAGQAGYPWEGSE